ncbi:MAG TPA: pitrilysin family protein [Solirubrobacteraceae bacterium]|nr:pitrilysin family protein [Solirubrobacteraceae bacterium]
MAATATDAAHRASESGHEITTLDSGVRVVTERIPAVRSVALGFLMDTGSVTESEQQAGISHLLEHMLFRGSANYGSEEIDQIFDEMGAELNAGTDKESTSVYTRVLDGHLERAFDVMADMVWRPRFEGLEAEREVVLEEIAMYEDDPQDRVFEEAARAVFGSHPLGRPVIGNAAAVAAIDREQLHAYRASRYTPGSVVIAAAGSVEHERLVALAERAQGSHEDPPARDTAAEAAARAPVEFAPRRVFLRKDTEQFHVCVGGAGIGRKDERRFALRVLEGILGGTSSSRLFQEIRERRGLAYSVFTYSNLFAASGEVGLYVGTRPENLVEALEIVAAELRRCVADPADEAELARSRENLKGRIVLGLESTSSRMGRLGGSVLAGMPVLSVDEMIERIDAVTVEDLRELAAELFAPERLAVAGVGPEQERFEQAIEPLGEPSQAASGERAA